MFSLLSCIFFAGTLGLQTKEQMEASIGEDTTNTWKDYTHSNTLRSTPYFLKKVKRSDISFILSKEASQGVFEDWEYKLISLFEPKPLDLAFKYFLIQEAGSATATQFYDQLKTTNK